MAARATSFPTCEEEPLTPEEPSEPAEERKSGQFYRQAWLFYLILAIIGVIWLGSHHGRISLDLFVDLTDWWVDLLLGLAAAALLIGLWQLARLFLPPMRELEAQVREMVGQVEDSEIIALALLSGFSEELLFRGAMQSSWGWIVATAIFALMHTGPGRAFRYWTAFALAAGAIFAGLTLYRGTLLAAIVSHVTVNMINLRRLAVGAATSSSK